MKYQLRENDPMPKAMRVPSCSHRPNAKRSGQRKRCCANRPMHWRMRSAKTNIGAIVHGRVVLTQQLPRRSGRGRKRRVPPGQQRLV